LASFVTCFYVFSASRAWLKFVYRSPGVSETGRKSASKFRNQPLQQQGCGGGAGAILDAWSRSLKFGFRFHRGSFLGKRLMQIMQYFYHFLDQIVLEPESKSSRILMPEPEIWVPAPQPCTTSKTADTSEVQSHHCMTPENSEPGSCQ